MKKNAKNLVPFRLAIINTEDIATFKDNYQEVDSPLTLEFDINIRTSDKDLLLGIFVEFTFSNETGPVFRLKCSCHFDIDEDYWQSRINGNSISFPPDLITHFLVLTIGTARGIIHAEKPEWLRRLLLPTLNVSEIITEELIFEIHQDKLQSSAQ